MYRYYKKNQMNVMEYDFDSISEFIDYLDNTPTSLAWNGKRLASEKNTYNFCKTNSLQEAKDLCKYGQHEKFDKLIKLKMTLEKYIKVSKEENRQYNYYVGYAPDVKAYLEGNPLSMFDKHNKKRKHVDIYYNAAVLGNVLTSQIFNRGAITLSLVEILESMGFSVGLNVFTMSGFGDKVHYAKFHLKQDDERLNMQKLYFPICNPSFHRRLVFRLREITPDITSDWTETYGKTSDVSTVREIIDLKVNDIIIDKPEKMGVAGDDIIDDANAMFDYINSFSNEDIELEHINRL